MRLDNDGVHNVIKLLVSAGADVNFHVDESVKLHHIAKAVIYG